jgi:hypothetical protein
MSDDLDAMEEGLQTSVTKELVEERVQDWKDRLHALFQDVRAWAMENGWRVDDSGTVGMHEELMQKFGVPATNSRRSAWTATTGTHCSSRRACG